MLHSRALGLTEDEDYEGWTDDVVVRDTINMQLYWLVPSGTDLGAGPLSEVRMRVDGYSWSTGPWGRAVFVGNNGDEIVTMTIKCEDPEGHALIYLVEDTNDDTNYNPEPGGPDQILDFLYVHGLED